MSNSRMSSFALLARMTISDANSMPGVRRSMTGRALRRTARMPQCASRTPVLKRTLRKPDSSGLPTYWCSQGIAPGWMFFIRLPMTRSAPSSSSRTKFGISWKSYVRSASPMTMYLPLAAENPPM